MALVATGMVLDRAANAIKEGGAVKADLRSLCKIGFFLLCNYVDHLQRELSAPKSRKVSSNVASIDIYIMFRSHVRLVGWSSSWERSENRQPAEARRTSSGPVEAVV